MDELFEKIKTISSNFNIPGEIIGYGVIDNGHINKTFYVTCSDSGENRRFLLQNINTSVFKNPIQLMSNVIKVIGFLKDKITQIGGDAQRETLTVFPTKDGENCYFDKNGSCWRIYNFVENSFTYNAIESPELFFSVGEAFGNFLGLLSDFPMDELYETIPDFHDTRKRVFNFENSVKNDTAGRVSFVADEISYVLNSKDKTGIIVDMLSSGELPMRVTHNDTKLNNVMFDSDTKKAVCVVDLDTVMPGSALYDFGDAIRYGANTGAEDEKDLSRVSLDEELYRQYVRGYMSKAAKSLTEKEVELLPLSAWMMTFECGMRFLNDYIDGDVYFGISYPEHNLDRCRSQFELAKDIERKFGVLSEITAKAYEEFK